MKLFTAICAAIFILTASCVSTKETAMQKKSLYGIKWSLKKIHSDSGVEDVQTKAFIKFDEAKQSAGGNGSCNSFGGNSTITRNEISIKNIFSTKMYCEDVQRTEDIFLKQLEKVNRYEIAGTSLSLYQGEKILLEFASE